MLRTARDWPAFCELLKQREPALRSYSVEPHYLRGPNVGRSHVSLGFRQDRLTVRMPLYEERRDELPTLWPLFQRAVHGHDPSATIELGPRTPHRVTMMVVRPVPSGGVDEQVAADWYLKSWRIVHAFWRLRVAGT